MKELDNIYKEYTESVFKYLYCLCKNCALAEELTQETFYQAVKSINSYNGKCKISVWLCQIAKFSYYKYVEKHKKEISTDIYEYENISGDYDVEKTLIQSQDKIFIFKEIHLLEEPYREVFLLRVLGDLSFNEIGDIHGKNENWARVTYYRAKIKIKERSLKNGGNV